MSAQYNNMYLIQMELIRLCALLSGQRDTLRGTLIVVIALLPYWPKHGRINGKNAEMNSKSNQHHSRAPLTEWATGALMLHAKLNA